MPKILVVDEPAIREVVVRFLRRDVHTVVQAADGEEALEPYRRTRPDLVVLDLMLLKVSGLEVPEAGGGWVPLLPFLPVFPRRASPTPRLYPRPGSAEERETTEASRRHAYLLRSLR